MILILTEPEDLHADIVMKYLKEKGSPYICFQTADFPQKTRLSIAFEPTGDEQTVYLDGERINLNDVLTVWYRRVRAPVPSSRLSQADQDFVLKQAGHTINGLWRLLGDRFWVNPYANDRAAHRKPYQLKVAREVGLEIPRTLISNEPNDVLEFFDRCKGAMVYKTLSNYGRADGGRLYGLYTTRVTLESLMAGAGSIYQAPAIFQEYVQKKVELRVTVIANKIFATEIDSQVDTRTKDDWRRLPEPEYLPHRAVTLPHALEAKILALMRRMGLVFGCLDLILTPDDRFLFLEINPSGQWYWIEELTGVPLLQNFAEMLIQHTPDFTTVPHGSRPINRAAASA